MNAPRSAKLALLTAIVPLACSVEPSHEDAASVDQSIINGTPVTSEDIGLVKILIPGSGCSGTLITPEWVLTAQHCLPPDHTDPTGTTVERTTTGEVRDAVQLIPFSTTSFGIDVGLIRVGEPFPIAAGPSGYTNELWPFAASDLVGQTVECYGYGNDTSEGTGFGTLRHASLLVDSFNASTGMYTFVMNALGQIQTYGDSGSGCFYTQGGQRYDLSVFTNPGGDRAFAYATAPLRAWVDLQVHNDCDDGIQSGSETGIDCGGSCDACPPPATLALTSAWDTGWCAQVTVTNYTASPTNSWTVQFDVHESSLYAQWGADYTNTGSLYTASNLAWNGRIPAQQSINFGFCANKTGANWQPELVSAEIH